MHKWGTERVASPKGVIRDTLQGTKGGKATSHNKTPDGEG